MNKKTDKITNTKSNTTSSLSVCFGGYSCAGLKEENQDAFAALIPDKSELSAKGAVAVIADGVSSASNAAQASQLSVTQFISEYYATPQTWSTQKSAAKVLTSLNQWLFSQDNLLDNLLDNLSTNQHSHHSQQHQQWLTTFSAIVLKSTTGYIFHVGDSRISQFRQQQFESITRDHNHKQGSKHLVLTRALGADERLKVDVHQIDLQAGDLYLLTCDGVHDFLSTKVFIQLLKKLPQQPSNKDLEQASKSIVQQALDAGSDDNLSCLLVYINEIPNRQLAEIERDLLSKTIPPALKVGMKLDGYKVRKVIHASIRSHLYLVEKEQDNKLLVLKVPSANFAEDALYLQGFKREAWVGERINHNNIMKIQRAKNNSQFLYHLCEYIEGQTLSEWMHDNPKPSIAQVRDIIIQIIAALRAFQRLELVHRDLKPENIMIDQFSQVKLIDYGTVKVAAFEEDQQNIKETVPMGSLNYIAPETCLKMSADNRSDLFSLGVICYEMLTGQLPFKPMQRAEILYNNYSQWQYRSVKQFRPELPLWLDITLEQATKADPGSRYQAFSEFLMDLNKPNINAMEEYKTQPLLQRNPTKFWQACSLFLLFALIISLFN
ncbi:MAG: bifunctional protein-serine/threonine kinase/phosphatase [Alteromonadaceae bacterium]|nr:bifunctional protein-serine/threonine kinase/phosphatase [Alteromonadaceae bacterium]